jgi:serine acetyltransferase
MTTSPDFDVRRFFCSMFIQPHSSFSTFQEDHHVQPTREDIASIRERDPAARNSWEVLTCYPGLHAVILHRWAKAAGTPT